jgi:acetyltransferase-like isoleucine patch superfamily enzyme
MFLKKLIKKILGIKTKSTDININYIGSKKPNIEIGKHSYINGIEIYCWDERINIRIGKYCSLADCITIIAGGEHDKDWVSTYPFVDRWNLEKFKYLKKPRYKGDIEVGNDVWIANGVTILSGVTIGNGSIIGAETVVTKNVPEYSIVVGNPMKIIKYRFDEDTINSLLKIEWWNWDEETIKSNQELFTNPKKFIEEFKK